MCPKNFICINENNSQNALLLESSNFSYSSLEVFLLNCSYPLDYSSEAFSVTFPSDIIRSLCDVCYFREIITVLTLVLFIGVWDLSPPNGYLICHFAQ